MVNARILFSFTEVAESLASVLAIIDLACKNEKAFALSSLLQVPLVKVDAIEDETPHKYALSVRPSYRVISDALFDVASFYSFNRVAVVYDGKSLAVSIITIGADKAGPREGGVSNACYKYS